MDAIKLPANLASNPMVMLGIVVLGGLLTKLIVAAMRGVADKFRKDKDPSNDKFIDPLEAAANAIDKAPPIKLK